MDRYTVGTDVSKRKRNKLAFFLFISLAVLSLSLCGRTVLLNSDTFTEMFTDSNYVTELHYDVSQYGKDLCKKVSLPDEFIKNTIRYNTVLELENAYVNTMLSDSDDYDDYAYGVLLEQLETDMVKATEKTIQEYGIKVDSKQTKTGAKRFARTITDYLQKRIEFSYMDELRDITNTGEKICTALAVLSFIACVGLIIGIVSLEGKLYRRLRGIAVSAVSAFAFNSIMLLAIIIVRITKDLVIYPEYLANAFMWYVDKSMLTIGISAILFVIIALALMSTIWAMKRYERE